MFVNYRENRVIHGDCFEILSQIPDKYIDLVVTDPPFYVMNKNDIKFENRTDIVQRAEFDNFSSYESFMQFTKKWVTQVAKKMKENSSMYCFFGAQYISDLMRICLDLNMTYKGIIVWHKTNPAPKIRKSGYLSSTELVLFMIKGNPTFNFLGQNAMHNMISTPICGNPERLVDYSEKVKGKYPTLHPTQKPLAIIKPLLEVSSNPEQMILDPFCGTGTTILASKMMKRFSIGIEKELKYAQAAQNRLQSLKES
jgi:site-specific DNA-methyltransferase (adenine-specific)/modification methylase